MHIPASRRARAIAAVAIALAPLAAVPPSPASAAPALYLPWPAGVAVRISQGPHGSFSHTGTSDEYAVDFDMATGDPVLASAPGTVFRAGNSGDGFGIAVYVDHGSGVCTQYAHLSRADVSVGQVVGQAQLLGRAGATGYATGDHLHWGRVRCDSIYVSVPASTVETGSSFPEGSRPVSRNGANPNVGPPTKEVFPFGDAVDAGSTAGQPLNLPHVGFAATATGAGYWLVASDGGVFPFGDATGHGSTGGIRLNKPIVGMAATPTGRGYWLVASDGGIFPFGDAPGLGSTGGVRLNQPVVGMAGTATGRGYWLVARDGGIFPFGDAQGLGSTGGIVLNQPIVGMAATPKGSGYWLVARDGGIFPFGDAPGIGRPAPDQLRDGRAVAIARTPTGKGYWVAATR